MSVYSSVCMEQPGFRWADFHGILRLNIFRKYVDKIEVSFQSDKNNGLYIYIYIYMYIWGRRWRS